MANQVMTNLLNMFQDPDRMGLLGAAVAGISLARQNDPRAALIYPQMLAQIADRKRQAANDAMTQEQFGWKRQEEKDRQTALAGAGQLFQDDPSLSGLPAALKLQIAPSYFKHKLGGDNPSAVDEFNFYKKLSPDDQSTYLRIKRGDQKADLGGSIVFRDPTGALSGSYRVTPKPDQMPDFRGDVAAAEEDARRRIDLLKQKPTAYAHVQGTLGNFDRTMQQLDELSAAPGLSNITGMVAGRTPTFSQEGRNAQALVDTIKNQTFVNALQSMRELSKTGGAVGNVSDKEGDRLENSMVALDQSQDTATYKKRLAEMREQLMLSSDRIRRAYRDTYGEDFDSQPVKPQTGGAGAVPPVAEGATATNRQTGQRIVFRGGKWVPMQ